MADDLFVSGDYLKHFRPEDPANPFRRIYRRKLEDVLGLLGSPDGALLDAGGGMGRLAVPLSTAGWRVVLADLSEAMLREAARRAGGSARHGPVVADAARLPFPDAAFGQVVAMDLLCHFPDTDAGLAELRRVLAPGGRLVIDSTNSNPLWTLFYPGYAGLSPRKWLGVLRHGGALPGWEGRVRHYREAEFLERLRRSGFTVERVLRYGPRVCPKWHVAVARRPDGGASRAA